MIVDVLLYKYGRGQIRQLPFCKLVLSLCDGGGWMLIVRVHKLAALTVIHSHKLNGVLMADGCTTSGKTTQTIASALALRLSSFTFGTALLAGMR
jgi:hypothetical protein